MRAGTFHAKAPGPTAIITEFKTLECVSADIHDEVVAYADRKGVALETAAESVRVVAHRMGVKVEKAWNLRYWAIVR